MSYELSPDVRLRPADARSDKEFLFMLYCSTREDLKSLGLPEESLANLLSMQFVAQTEDYERSYPTATHHIIDSGPDRVGRLIEERSGAEILGIDLAVLPEHRSRGIGGTILRWLIDEALSNGLKFVLHVAKHNRALRLYERMGGKIVADTGTHFRMEWTSGKTRGRRP